MYTDPELVRTDPPENFEARYTESELEALYMGTESEARKRFQRQGSYR